MGKKQSKYGFDILIVLSDTSVTQVAFYCMNFEQKCSFAV